MKRVNVRRFLDLMSGPSKPDEPLEVLRGVDTIGYYYPKGTMKYQPDHVIKAELREVPNK